MQQLPSYIYGLAIFINIIAVVFFYFVTGMSRFATIVLICWLCMQAALSLSGFYLVTDTVPPRFLLMVLPPLITIVLLFTTRLGRSWINKCDASLMYMVHVIRLPIEIMLYLLFVHKMVPGIMTFEDGNYDILSGITAPLVYYFIRKPGHVPGWILISWNLACLALLFNVVYHAVLSAPTPFQQFAFDQPNIAILYFPFSWLPAFLVPLVLFCHLVCIRQALRSNTLIKTPVGNPSL